MSIHIGSVPLSQNSTDVFTIYSTKSNVVKLQSPSNTVLMDIGDYNVGQRSSNGPFVFSYKNSNIITYDSNNISFNRDIVATCNLNILGSLKTSSELSSSKLSTGNLIIKNPISNGDRIIDCSSNNIETFYLINDNNGTGYIGGRLGIGVIPSNKKYSLITSSNIFVNGDISGEKVIADKIISNNNVCQILFDTNSITIDAPTVTVNNLYLGGQNIFSKLQCTDAADIKGLLLASNVSIHNKDAVKNPFKINQRLINLLHANNIYGNPISVKSQHINIQEDPTIFELSSCGNLVLGDYPSLRFVDNTNIICDYVLRGNIPANREKHFKGYLSFSSDGIEKTSFNVNKSGQLSIGSLNNLGILDIVNDFTGSEIDYVKPTSIIHLRNNNTSNELPFFKCANSNLKMFQITSNATICFNETPMNTGLYNIESDNNYLSNIDTCKISSYYPDGIINMSYSTLSNLNTVVSCNIDTSNLRTSNLSVQNMNVVDSYIKNLEVSSFSTVGLSVSSSVFGIESERLIISGKNMIVSKDIQLPLYANKDTDKLVIRTEKSALNANGYIICGNNKSITLLCKNESTLNNSYVAQELQNTTGGFAFVSKFTSSDNYPELYITPIITSEDTNPYENPALTILYDKSVLLSSELFVQIDTSYISPSEGFSKKSVNIGKGLLVYESTIEDGDIKYVCLATNKYGSVDTGRGISSASGPFNKQGGWQFVETDGTYIIEHDEYGVTVNTAGTIFIQVQGPNKIGNASLSFLRFSGPPDLFTISCHKSPDLSLLKITAHADGIKVQTDSDCDVCWTSIGSC